MLKVFLIKCFRYSNLAMKYRMLHSMKIIFLHIIRIHYTTFINSYILGSSCNTFRNLVDCQNPNLNSAQPHSYGISDSVAALRYHRRCHFGLYIAIDHLLTRTYRGHMPKFGLKSQKFNEILRFAYFEIMSFFPFVDTQKLL